MDYIKRLQQAAKRNREIARLIAGGMSKAAVARKFGISRQRVHQVLTK